MSLAALSRVDVESRTPMRLHDGIQFPFPTSEASVRPHQQGGGNTMQLNRRYLAGNSSAGDTRDIPAFSITHGDWLKRVSSAFREDVGDRPGAAKELARKLECSPKTTQSWLDGETAPSGILDLRAMHCIPAYAALKREIAAMETDLDPRLQAKLRELHELTVALANGSGQ